MTDPTEQDHIDAIYDAARRVETANRDLRTAVQAARRAKPRPVTWEKIGAAIGISRQGAAERFTPLTRHRR